MTAVETKQVEDLHFLSIAEAADLIAARRLSPSELTDCYLDRIAALESQVNAFITVTADLARHQARCAEQEIAAGIRRGPLHGIPIGLKDMFDTAGILTTAHSKVLANNYPQRNAWAVEKLYAAGAVLLGKQACHEFAHGGPSFDLPWPPARNPWNTGHYSGGSSSGSAAAVGAGLAAGALGTDTGGSIRSPSFLCGTVGLKPTFGMVGRTGVIPFSSSCDHVGPMTRTVEDAAILLQAIAGHDPQDVGSSDAAVPDFRASIRDGIKGLRIGVVRHFWEEDAPANAELCAAVEQAITVLAGLGAEIETVRLRPLKDYYAVRITLTESELFARHLSILRERPGAYGHHFLGRILAAALFTSADYIAAQRERRRMIAEMQPIYRRYDALVTAGGGPAPNLQNYKAIGSTQKWAVPGMTPLFSVTGAPALALPCGFSKEGLPMGFQIAGRPFEDATVLRIGHAYEQATRWFGRRPDLKAGDSAPAIRVEDEHGDLSGVDPALVRRLESFVQRAGLTLSEEQMALLCDVAPYATALTDQLPRGGDWTDEQAAIFRLQSAGNI